MRGYLFLRGLAERYRVTLIAGSPLFPDESAADLDALGSLVEDAVLLPFRASRDPALLVRRLGSAFHPRATASRVLVEPSGSLRARLARLPSREFVRVHVFRLYMLRVAHATLDGERSVPMQLDLDDWESQTRLNMAALAGSRHSERARGMRAEAAVFEALEREWLPRFARVFVCSEDDATALASRHELRNIAVVGNAVAVPESLAPMTDAEPAHVLFVGSLGYSANEDAVRFLLDDVLPRLRAVAPRQFRLVVAGVGAPARLRARLRVEPEVTWVDSPTRVEPLYARALAALAPIRAGGGTRLKVLEAFAHGRPLIATAAAVAGFDVEPGIQYARAETASQWAEGVCSLLEDPEAGFRLASSAYAWVRRHSLESAIERVAAFADMD
jgi:glycosyltransferase involved in cell wall biosynthesis